jgi:hypothetical protein
VAAGNRFVCEFKRIYLFSSSTNQKSIAMVLIFIDGTSNCNRFKFEFLLAGTWRPIASSLASGATGLLFRFALRANTKGFI